MSVLFRALFLLVLLTGLSVAAIGGYILWDINRELPSVDGMRDLQLNEPLRIYSSDGLLMGEYGAERREPLRFAQFPPRLVQAFLAAEDDRFFSHPGVDWQGLARAAIQLAITGRKTQGGSTITMQLARNFFLSSERTYTRKIKEILLALKIENELSKEEVLEFYLNKIFLGHRAYGVGAAAQIYYQRDLESLSLAETAMIAGLPKAPSAYNPITDPARATERRNYVLRRMHELGYISDAEFSTSRRAPVTARLRPVRTELPAHYVAEMVRAEIVERYGIEAYTAGLKVRTTIDGARQRAATEAVQLGLLEYDRRHDWRGAQTRSDALSDLDWRQMDPARLASSLAPLFADRDAVGPLLPALVLERGDDALVMYAPAAGVVAIPYAGMAWPLVGSDETAARRGDWLWLRPLDEGWELAQLPAVQGALVALDPEDGAVQAMVGGFDYFVSKFNRAEQAQRQPGSAFKPFLYSAALEHGYNLASVINDAPVVFNDPALEDTWRPENYSGRFYGPTRLRVALINSRNLVSIRLLRAIGIGPARRHAQLFGFDLRRLPGNLSLSLGSGTYSPLEMARAYAVFANGGFGIKPYLIREIRDSRDQAVFTARPETVCLACEAAAKAAALRSAQAKPEPEPEPELEPEPEPAAEPGPELPPARRVVSAENAYLMTDLMRDVVNRGTARRALSLGRRDLAGKTGTTNDQRDAWFCGFTPELVATAWVGFDDLTPLGRGEVGGKAALPVWMHFMQQALDGVPERALTRPAGIVNARIDPETGRLARTGDAGAIFELFMEGRLPEAAPERGAVDAYRPGPQETVVEELF